MGELIGVCDTNKDGLMPHTRYNNSFGVTDMAGNDWYKIFSGESNGFYCVIIDAYRHIRNSKTMENRKVLIQLDLFTTAIILQGEATDLIGYVMKDGTIDIYIKNNYDSRNNVHLIADISVTHDINRVVDPKTAIKTEPFGIIYV